MNEWMNEDSDGKEPQEVTRKNSFKLRFKTVVWTKTDVCLVDRKVIRPVKKYPSYPQIIIKLM